MSAKLKRKNKIHTHVPVAERTFEDSYFSHQSAHSLKRAMRVMGVTRSVADIAPRQNRRKVGIVEYFNTNLGSIS